MKFAAGGSLSDAAQSLRHDPRRIVRMMAKVSLGVQHAHLKGILHRDLKPGNVLLDDRGEPLVSDFGLAKWLDTTSDLTRTLTSFGTPGYIAPEQAQGSAKNVTAAADIYGLGAVLFYLLTGRPPFIGKNVLAVIKQASDRSAPKLQSRSHLCEIFRARTASALCFGRSVSGRSGTLARRTFGSRPARFATGASLALVATEPGYCRNGGASSAAGDVSGRDHFEGRRGDSACCGTWHRCPAL